MYKKTLRILVIEDHNFQRKAVVHMLHSLSVEEVWQANNGKQALEMIRAEQSRPLDIVMCDLDMPEMDGMEFLRHLAQEQPGVSTIILSGMDGALITSVEKMAHSYGLHLLGAVEKPLSLEQLEMLLGLHQENKLALAAPRYPSALTPKRSDFTLQEIQQAVEAKNIQPFLQPKISLLTGQIIGAEALARWIHPQYGVIPPDAFIPLLERSDNMEGLTFLMLESTAKACLLLRKQGYDLDISVNISVSSLRDTSLAERITRVVLNTGLEPKHIILEVTESAAMSSVAEALENLARLRMRGFGLSIDDYGTGFSSMQQLTRVPFTELKIDKSFISDSANNSSSRVVVESSIQMAQKLKVKSVAEGVESRSEWDMLQGMSCDVAQGYFIAKPMDVESFITYCKRYSPLSARHADA
ncbi:MAG: EAL domain-containing response regulator [Gallionella sp.]|nr:EAL domain-containing response regulator [Gallionella sp.]